MPATTFSLPLGTRLGEFELTGVLGEGGFSVVYMAIDHSLARTVAIKEYMPSAIATRLPDGAVLPKSQTQEETFNAGLASFLNEARLLAKFTHPALVHIHRIWEQNGTAYMAMQYCVGQTLRQINQSASAETRDEEWLKAIVTPILDVLELLHAQNCFHRDISPDNILILQDGGPILLDFGAAQQIIGDMTQGLTVILRPGFAPIEQYADDANLQQGPWTDVYGVGAVLYYLLMGKPPIASVARLVKDPMVKLADSNELTGISHSFREAIDRALAVQPSQRIQSIAELRDALQLPAFKPDRQIGKLPVDTSSEEGITNTNQVSSQDQTDSGAGLGYSTNGSSPLVKTAPLFSSYSNQNTDIGAQGLKSNTAATVKIACDLLRNRNIILLIIFFIAALTIALALFYKSTPDVGENTRTTIQKPITDEEMKLAPSSDLSIQQRTDNQVSTATTSPIISNQVANRQENIPATSKIIVPNDNKKEFSQQKSDALPIREKIESIPSKHSIEAITQKAPVNPIAEPQQHTATVATTASINSSSSAGTNLSPKIHQSIERPDVPARMVIAPEPPSAAPSKMPVVYLSIKPWGQVLVNGQSQGISPPLTHLSLTPGKHVVVIKNGNFPPATIKVTVPEQGDIVIFHRF